MNCLLSGLLVSSVLAAAFHAAVFILLPLGTALAVEGALILGGALAVRHALRHAAC